jgi:hypothetical protein
MLVFGDRLFQYLHRYVSGGSRVVQIEACQAQATFAQQAQDFLRLFPRIPVGVTLGVHRSTFQCADLSGCSSPQVGIAKAGPPKANATDVR